MLNLRLKEERARLGLTQPAFAEHALVKKRTVVDWEKGESSPTAVQLQSLSKVGVDVRYLVTGIADDYAYISNNLIGESELTLAFRKDWINKKKLKAKDLMLYNTKDDSMSPTIVDEDVLLLQTYVFTEKKENGVNIKSGLPVTEKLEQDGIYLIKVDRRYRIKRLQLDIDGGALILSDNPAYEKETATKEKINEIVIGRVVWIGKNLI